VANALAKESSPYLRQHAENPVDWLPWGEQALSRARAQERPLLVSIGYSACHWCHVMERESFEDERVAALMNENFVCVKVDREERPDIDAIYMEALQALSGSGGWPLNVFLTPEQMPFFGGTYFPPKPRPGMPSWSQVLEAIAQAWSEQSGEIRERVEQLRGRLAGGALLAPSKAPLDPSSLSEAVARLAESYDSKHGGFGGAPKFPQPSVIEFLLADAAANGTPKAAEMALGSLRAIAAGGIHDLVGGGFHRYSVDAQWAVPHFEKMLYDNAQLVSAYLHAFKLDGDPALLEVALRAIEFLQRELQDPEGGFYAALDADSGGVEGAYYVWSLHDIREVLGADAEAAIAWTGATEQGNFVDPHHPVGGLNVLSDRPLAPRPDPATIRRVKAALLEARSKRLPPGLDDKRLASWNALAISALAQTGAHLISMGAHEEPTVGLPPSADRQLGEELIEQARHSALFVFERLVDQDGTLLRTYSASTAGTAPVHAFLEDHAFLLEALLELYQASFEEHWFLRARALADTMIDRFADPEAGGFFSTASDAPALVARRKDLDDTPIPAGASSAAVGLLRLAALTGEISYEQAALGAIRLLQEIAPQHPLAFGHMLQAMLLYAAPIAEVAIVGAPGAERDALVRVVRERHRPTTVLALGPGDGRPSTVPLLAGRSMIEGRPAAYVCERFSCLRPVCEPSQLRELLDG
jgi:uncharacterized protein YyaL (SSP411 family)